MFAPRPIEHFLIDSRWLRQSKNLRIDASFYNPRVARAIEALNNSGLTIKRLGEVTKRVFFPNRFKRIYVDREHGIPFLGGRQMMHFHPADLKYLSTSAHKNIPELVIKHGWILVSRSGTVGRVAMVPKDWDGWVASEHILRVIPNETACPPGYLYAFLDSQLGYVQLTSQIYGAVVDELTEDHVRNVLVPIPNTVSQERAVSEINDSALLAIKKRAEASILGSQAVDHVYGLVPMEPEIQGETVEQLEVLAVNAPGPKPEMLKIGGDWREAMKKSLQVEKPISGWPK